MTCFNQNHALKDDNASRRTQANHAVEAGAARSGPPRYSNNSVHPDFQATVIQTLVSGRQNGISQEQYAHSIAIASQQLGNRAFVHWLAALHAAGSGGGADTDAVPGRQAPVSSTPVQFMPKKRNKKEPAAEVTPEGQTETAPEAGTPEVSGATPDTPSGAVAQAGAEAAAARTQAQAKQTAVAGEKKKKKKSRVQVALNTLREKGVAAFKDYLEAEIDETALLDTLTERVQRAQNLAGMSDAALGTIAARMGQLDPEGIPAMPSTLAPAVGQFAERPVIAPARTVITFREKQLFECCTNGNAGRLRSLLRNRKPDVNLAMNYWTPLSVATINGRTAVVRELLSEPGIDVNLAQAKGATPLLIAAQYGHVEIVRLLMERRGNPALGTTREGTTPLAVAALKGQAEVVKLLLSFRNVNVDIRQYDGSTPLFAAVQGNSPEIVKLLLSGGADVNLPLTEGTTPLCRAVYQGSVEMVGQLLQAPGIQVNRATDEKATALFFACQTEHGEIVKLLLSNRADPNLVDVDGVAPLHLACLLGSTEIVEWLLDAGADMEMVLRNAYTPYQIACIGGYQDLATLLAARMQHPAGTATQPGSLSPEEQAPCARPPEPAPLHSAGAGSTQIPAFAVKGAGPGSRHAPEQRPEQSTPSGTSTVSSTQAAVVPAGSSDQAVQTARVAGGDVPGTGTATAEVSRSGHTPETPTGAETDSPLGQAKQEFRKDILARVRSERLDHFSGIRLLEAVNLVTDLDGLCGIYNRLAGIERTQLRSGRRSHRRPVSGQGAGVAPPVAGCTVFSLGEKQNLDADAAERVIKQHLAQPFHRFVSQALNDMEFGRGKPTSGYPGLWHTSAGIAGVGSCSVFFYVDTDAPVIRIAGIGHHLDRETYRLDYAVEELGGSGAVLRLS